LRVRAAGLKLFIVSINNLQCRLCIGGSLRLNNTLAARGLEELFSSCGFVSVFGSGGK
jgi:hypothetical protein